MENVTRDCLSLHDFRTTDYSCTVLQKLTHSVMYYLLNILIHLGIESSIKTVRLLIGLKKLLIEK